MEKSRAVMINNFLPAGRNIKMKNETMGRKIAKEMNSRRLTGLTEKSIWRASMAKIRND